MDKTIRVNRYEIAKEILLVLGLTGLVLMPVAGPLTFMMIADELGIGKYSKRRVSQSLRILKNQKLVGISKDGDKTVVRLTKNGRNKLLKYKLEEMAIERPRKWDRKWRVVIFDIPEKFKLGRDYLRAKLKELGFYQLQKSVWVCPYPCEDEIDFIKEVYEIRPFVRILIVETVDMQQDLIKHFNL